MPLLASRFLLRYRPSTSIYACALFPVNTRCLATATATVAGTKETPAKKPKQSGDISDAFTSLSGKAATPLPDRFRALKLRLVAGHEDDVVAGWDRLLAALRAENDVVAARGSAVVPEIRFSRLEEDLASRREEIRKRGVAVVRGVIPEDEARAYKFEVEEYVGQNPQTRGFPPNKPQVFELYWSPPQIRARAHPNLLRTQTALLTGLWRAADPSAPVSLKVPISYADRLRIRQPGDAQFALGPHMDGGSVERWEVEGYGRGEVYDAVFRGAWDDAAAGAASWDPFDAGARVAAVSNLYDGLGACSVFRAFQGWLAMSRAAPGQGTLLVNPLLRESTAYLLLRPFFRPLKTLDECAGDRDRFLDARNWVFTAGADMTSDLQGATPGHGQEFPEGMHPHLELDRTMIHIPEVRPGDFVVWHCDTIHAVDKVHSGTSDSSVLYIPVCPTTEASAEYVARQREAFLQGTPAPDFPGGEGESMHVGRPTRDDVLASIDSLGVKSMGLAKLMVSDNATQGEKDAIQRANAKLGF